ncbi:MAG: hypothetical protein K0R25_312 [Rickettsiaceae bacterium]|jgi:hypothetical protein|nr:hypothetical protein [Rickettsiaceae bacterium]
MNKKLFFALILPLFISFEAFAEDEIYPNISGTALFELKADRITSSDDKNIDTNHGNINIDTEFALNLSKKWSVITNWRFKPVLNRDPNNPERYRNILSYDRDVSISDEGLTVEQLKGQFENEDARFFFGKFNPVFGSAFRKEKRISAFITDYTRDYELIEKIGFGGTAILEHTEITLDAFFNDTTGLNNSAIKKRGREKRSDGIAGNTSTPSSYTIAVEGQDLLGVKDLFYNVGYRNLNVDNMPGRDNEKGFVGGLEYLFPITLKASLIPFVEVVSLKNFSGEEGRNATYATLALIWKYSSWTASVSNVSRDIKSRIYPKQNDRQTMVTIGYKFGNNIALDVSRGQVKEGGNKASLIGGILSYVHNF